MPDTSDLGIAVARGRTAGGAAVLNPNLLTKTEQFDNAAWIKSAASVVADAGTDPLGGVTADEITNASSLGAVSETSLVVAASGTATAAVNPTASWGRFSVTATFDVGVHTFSCWLCDPTDSGFIVRLRLDVDGGFIRCRLLDAGDQAIYRAWGAKLEVGSAPTGTTATYGAVA